MGEYMKKILLLVLISAIISGIYFKFSDNKTLYVNIGDDVISNSHYETEVISHLKKNHDFENYIEYKKKNYRITDFINDINQNKIYRDNKTINNLLIKADLITIWIGFNDINYKINSDHSIEVYDYLDEILDDMNQFLNLVRKNSKEQIIMVGLYNYYGDSKKEYYNYYNNKLKELCQTYKVDYIDSDNILSTDNIQDQYLNDSGKKIVGKEILKMIKK